MSFRTNKSGNWLDSKSAAEQAKILNFARTHAAKTAPQKLAKEKEVVAEKMRRLSIKAQTRENQKVKSVGRKVKPMVACLDDGSSPTVEDVQAIMREHDMSDDENISQVACSWMLDLKAKEKKRFCYVLANP